MTIEDFLTVKLREIGGEIDCLKAWYFSSNGF